jgi:oligopeptide transport system permease protein
MARYIFRRLLGTLPTLFLIVTISFFLIRLAPGGPFDLERPLDAKIMENLNKAYGLDQPLYVQYGMYLANVLRGDFGPSYVLHDFRVADLFAKGLPISIRLGLSALLISVLIGGALGTLAALRQNKSADYAVIGLATIGVTIPTFVVAPVLQIVFGLWLSWLPVAGWGNGALRHTVLPIVVLSLPLIAVIARLTRASMIETLRANHIRTLRAQGLGTRTIIRHALRGASLPVVSYLGPAAAAVLTGSVVVETIFGLPGIGRYFVESALNRDYTVVMGTVVVVAVFVMFFNLLVDVIYAMLDPRVRYE